MGVHHKQSATAGAVPIGVLALCLLLLTGSVLGADRSEREPGDRDRVDGFVKRHPESRDVEPGDAFGQGDFTQAGALDREVEPESQGAVQRQGPQTARPAPGSAKSGLPRRSQ
ncbi:MAG: hypothetical protein HQL88_00265 [Magnetococcales bacterium]|nr:hypothetical protein [Magnetococcales bacterium]